MIAEIQELARKWGQTRDAAVKARLEKKIHSAREARVNEKYIQLAIDAGWRAGAGL